MCCIHKLIKNTEKYICKIKQVPFFCINLFQKNILCIHNGIITSYIWMNGCTILFLYKLNTLHQTNIYNNQFFYTAYLFLTQVSNMHFSNTIVKIQKIVILFWYEFWSIYKNIYDWMTIYNLLVNSDLSIRIFMIEWQYTTY